MLANYGYADASGEYFITIDTDKCNGCGKCVEVCFKGIFVVINDDYDDAKAIVKDETCRQLAHLCVPEVCGYRCRAVCEQNAISHSW